MKHRSCLVLLGLIVPAAALAASLGVVLGGVSGQEFSELAPQVRETFTSALIAWETDGYGTPGTVENNVPPPLPTAAEATKQQEAGYADAENYFAQDLAARLKARIDRSTVLQKDPNLRMLGAGVENLVIESVEFDDSGSSVTVMATYTHWADSAELDPASGLWTVFTPSNDHRATVTMDRQASGEWVVTDYLGKFINGTGP